MFRSLSILFAVIFASHGAVPTVSWVQLSGGEGDDEAYDITVDGQGNVYTTGSLYSTNAWFGTNQVTTAGDGAMFLAKFDKNGSNIWAVTGGKTSAQGRGVSTDDYGNAYVSGTLGNFGDEPFGTTNISSWEGRMFLAKYDSNGVFQWVIQVGDSSVASMQPSRISGGKIFVTGTSWNTVYLEDQVLTDAPTFLAVYDLDGHLLSARALVDGRNNASATELAVDKDGAVYVGIDFGSDTITFGGTNVQRFGVGSDSILTKWDSAGNLLWFRHLKGGFYGTLFGVTLAPDGDVLVSGNTRGAGSFDDIPVQDAFIARLSPAGNVRWLNNLTVNAELGSMVIDSTGRLLISGALPSGVCMINGLSVTNYSTGFAPFIASLDGQGTLESVICGTISSTNSFYGKALRVVLDNADNAYVCGMSESLDFGGSSATGSSLGDILLARIAAGAPSLQFGIAGNMFELRWPTNRSTYALETCGQLGSTWQRVATPGVVNDRFVFTTATTNSTRLFRLVEE